MAAKGCIGQAHSTKSALVQLSIFLAFPGPRTHSLVSGASGRTWILRFKAPDLRRGDLRAHRTLTLVLKLAPGDAQPPSASDQKVVQSPAQSTGVQEA